VNCFYTEFFFFPRHKKQNSHQLSFSSARLMFGIQKKKNRHGICFLWNLGNYLTLKFPPALSQRRPTNHTGGPSTAPFHTSAVFEICLSNSLLPSPTPLFAAGQRPSERREANQHTHLAAVDSVFRNGVWGSSDPESRRRVFPQRKPVCCITSSDGSMVRMLR
jgi:hypothetical protein